MKMKIYDNINQSLTQYQEGFKELKKKKQSY